jgi:hypothetical protein
VPGQRCMARTCALHPVLHRRGMPIRQGRSLLVIGGTCERTSPGGQASGGHVGGNVGR